MKNFLLKLFAYFFKEPTPLPIPEPPKMAQPQPKIETMQEMVLRVCKEKKLTKQQTNDVYNTIRCESQFKNTAVNQNKLNGKVLSTDYGICQINDYYHIGVGKSFPSVDFVKQNPDKVVAWMCDMAKAGKLKLWVCYSKNLFKKGYVEVV